MLPNFLFLGATWCSKVWGRLDPHIWHVNVAPSTAEAAGRARIRHLTCGYAAERATGIEPAYPAWEAGALPLSYARRAAGSPRKGPRAARGVSVADGRADSTRRARHRMDLAKRDALIEHVRARGGPARRSPSRSSSSSTATTASGASPRTAPRTSLETCATCSSRCATTPRSTTCASSSSSSSSRCSPTTSGLTRAGPPSSRASCPDEVDALLLEAEVDPSGGPASNVDWLIDAPAIPEGHHYVGVWWADHHG